MKDTALKKEKRKQGPGKNLTNYDIVKCGSNFFSIDQFRITLRTLNVPAEYQPITVRSPQWKNRKKRGKKGSEGIVITRKNL